MNDASAPSVEELEIASEARVTIAMSRWTRERPEALIVAPGFFRSRRSPMLVALSARLAARYDVYCFDFRGHGTSTGRYTFGRREDRDFQAVLAHVRARRHQRIAVIGFSMGGTVAVRAVGAARQAGSDPGVSALVTVSAPTEVVRLRPRLPPRGLLERTLSDERSRMPRIEPRALLGPRLGTLAAAAWVSPTPWLVLHNEGDWLVPERMGIALYEAAREPRRLHLFRNRGRYHADALVRSIPDELYGVLEPFLAQHLDA